MKKLYGITGLAGSGKDTVADYLGLDHAFTKIAFADPLKAAAASMFGLDHRHFHDRRLKEVPHPYWGLSPRRLLQLLGNDAAKPHFGNDIWVKRWKLSYDAVRDTDNVVVPDVRFELEAEHIRAAGGVIIHITRPNAGLDGEHGQHASEAGIKFRDGDYLLYNDGDLVDLYDEVDLMVDQLGKVANGIPS